MTAKKLLADSGVLSEIVLRSSTCRTTPVSHLRRSVQLHPSFREQGRRDEDLAAVRDDLRFEQALR